MSYVMLFHQTPLRKKLDYHHFFVEIQPAFQFESKLKYTAGIERIGVFEFGAGKPEQMAKDLRKFIDIK